MSMNFFEMQSIAQDLFAALDNTVEAQYHQYQIHGGEYPSSEAIKALGRALNYAGFESSKALNIMNDNLAEDMLREDMLREVIE